jgi:hypothetical protein
LYADSPLRAYVNEAGVHALVCFWDPLGWSASGSAFDYKRRREVELKHGCVPMFATIGYIVPGTPDCPASGIIPLLVPLVGRFQ